MRNIAKVRFFVNQQTIIFIIIYISTIYKNRLKIAKIRAKYFFVQKIAATRAEKCQFIQQTNMYMPR